VAKELSFPFAGDFGGCAWNSQALFAQKPSKQFKKKYRAQQLISKQDFGIFLKRIVYWAEPMHVGSPTVLKPNGLTVQHVRVALVF